MNQLKFRCLQPLHILILISGLFITTSHLNAEVTLDRELPQLVPQQGSISAVTKLAFSPDGQQLVTSGGVAIVWDVASGKELARLADHQGSFPSVVYSQDGNTIFSIDRQGNPIAWEWKTGKKTVLPAGNRRVENLASCGHGKFLLGISGKSLIVWSIQEGRVVYELAAHTEDIGNLAVSKDCSYAMTASFSGEVMRWDLIHGQLASKWHSPRAVTSIAISPADDRIAIGHLNGYVSVMNFPIIRLNALLAEHTIAVTSLAFSNDGKHVVTGGEDGLSVVWDFYSDRVIRRFKDVSKDGADFVPRFRSVAFSPTNQNLVATAGYGKYAILWDIGRGEEIRRFQSKVNWARSVAVAADGNSILVGNWDHSAVIWDVKSGKITRRLEGHSRSVISVAFSPDGKRALTGGSDKAAILWDLSNGSELLRLKTEGYVESVTFLPDGQSALLGTYNKALLWNLSDGIIEKTFDDGRGPIPSVGVSEDGAWGITGSIEATLWNIATGTKIRQFGPSEYQRNVEGPSALSSSGRIVVTTYRGWENNGVAIIWDAMSGSEMAEIRGVTVSTAHSQLHYDRGRGHEGGIMALAIARDDSKLVTGGKDGMLIIWDIATGKPIRHLSGHSGMILSTTISPDGSYILSGSSDGTSRIWSMKSGDLIATLISFSKGGWAVIREDGRFDTNEPETLAGLNWVFSDDPTTPLSPEVFMRDYYEPRLLSRLLECIEAEKTEHDSCKQKFKEIRPLGSLNRAQPEVRILSIISEPGASDEVAVTVELRDIKRSFGNAEQQRSWQSGLYDLRLFRGGQLVGQWPEPKGGNAEQDDLAAWQVANRIPTANGTTQTTHTFQVRLASRDKGKAVPFTAYAFNKDRVKSETARNDTYKVPDDIPLRTPRAYVLTVGVNTYDNPSRNLSFAVNDADVLAASLGRIQGYEVVSISLLSDTGHLRGKAEEMPLNQATKANIRAVLHVLAGKNAGAERERLKGVAGIDHGTIDKLAKATPDDVMILTFSGHGHATRGGRFYLLPSDSGPEETITDVVLSQFISSEELSEWLREVDAGEMVMVIDACHSAASVDTPGFKPGPMGDRGLGQLAYDKGMIILAATQAADVALESEKIGQGLLTYALVQEGLGRKEDKKRQADLDGDGTVTLAEWLRYGEKRVPGLYEDLKTGKFSIAGRDPAWREHTIRHAQTPALFDFHRQNEHEVHIGP